MKLCDIFRSPVVTIAEIGLNHNGDVAAACNMIASAAKCGASAVKFQTFVPELMYSRYTKSLMADGTETEEDLTLVNFFKSFTLTAGEHKELFDIAARFDVEFFSSPFDEPSLELLERLGVRLYKIASSEVTNHPLLKLIGKTGKPAIMSTGMASEQEIRDALAVLNGAGCPDVALMHCVSLYPLPPESVNLHRIETLKKLFGTQVGFSDHSQGFSSAVGAAAMGATIIEKHFMLTPDFDCPDKDVSLAPDGFAAMVQIVNEMHSMLGDGTVLYGEAEGQVARSARKSLFAARDIPAHTVLSAEDLAAKRPGVGIPIYKMEQFIGKKTNRLIRADFMLREEYVD